MDSTIILWIDSEIDNEENSHYLKELNSSGISNLKSFKKVEEGIDYIKQLKFEKTKIIVSGRLFPKFIEKFKEAMKDIYITPKIIIFTRDEKKFLNENEKYKEILYNSFYNIGGIKTTFEEIFKFLKNNKESIIKKDNKYDDNIELTFEYIDCIEKLELPLFYKSLISLTDIDNIKSYTELIYLKYSKNDNIKKLLQDIVPISDIPIEILCKYYIRIYTAESDFYHDINTDLRNNKKENYLPFIKILYEGIRLKALKIASNNELYRGAKIHIEEINKIKTFLNKKIKNLPGAIVFSKSFLSFSKDRNIAEGFLKVVNKNKNLKKVLYILEKDDNINYSLSTHCDIENLSFIQKEKEVLFFPFSSFEIKEVKEKRIDNDIEYEIKLLYLGKYLKEIEKDNNIINKENKIPDGMFKELITKNGLIKNENINNTKQLFNQFKKFKQNINNNEKTYNINNFNINNTININNDEYFNDNNYIIGTIKIDNEREHTKAGNQRIFGEWVSNKNENIFDIMDIKIKKKTEMENGEQIILKEYERYRYFDSEGEYIIEYSFKKNIIEGNNMFSGCSAITSLDFSHFNTRYITNMSRMFFNCISLKNLNLSNFDTKNVIGMENMFYGCSSLKSLDLSNFDTKNVIGMKYMFYGCSSLKSLDLSSFDTKNVNGMDYMFCLCSSLFSLDLSNFDTKNVNGMDYMFCECSLLKNLDLSNFDTKNVKSMNDMFKQCQSLSNLNIFNSNNQNVNSMENMFCGCSSLKSLDLSNFNSQNLQSMENMFCGCSSLKSLDLSNFDTKNVKSMKSMFGGCSSLSSLDLSSFDTKNVIHMESMFNGCSSLRYLNLSNFKTQNETLVKDMFAGCDSLKMDNLIINDKHILKENDILKYKESISCCILI